jgi:hypothetical protein
MCFRGVEWKKGIKENRGKIVKKEKGGKLCVCFWDAELWESLVLRENGLRRRRRTESVSNPHPVYTKPGFTSPYFSYFSHPLSSIGHMYTRFPFFTYRQMMLLPLSLFWLFPYNSIICYFSFSPSLSPGSRYHRNHRGGILGQQSGGNNSGASSSNSSNCSSASNSSAGSPSHA